MTTDEKVLMDTLMEENKTFKEQIESLRKVNVMLEEKNDELQKLNTLLEQDSKETKHNYETMRQGHMMLFMVTFVIGVLFIAIARRKG